MFIVPAEVNAVSIGPAEAYVDAILGSFRGPKYDDVTFQLADTGQ